MSWTIKGEAGKTLDATARSLESLNICGAILHFQSLANDTLTWKVETENATGTGTIIPDIGQVVELYWNSTRKFRGHVTAPSVGMREISITAEGPWLWMERTNLTSDQTDATGVTAERASYVFQSQSLATSIAALIARAITNGVPMAAGSVDTMFTVPRMTLSKQSCAAALVTLMSWCPDAVAWFDYSGSTPVLNISRRGAMAATTLTIGTDAVEIGEISPRLDLEVARNEIHYVVRNATTGKPAWASQASGTDAAGKRQIVTVSGPEIVDFLPKDDFESVVVSSTPYASLNLANYDTTIQDAAKTYGPANYATAGAMSSTATLYYGTPPWCYPSTQNFPSLKATSKTGQAIPGTHGYFVTSTAPLPDWAVTELGAIEVTLTGTWVVYETAGPGWSPIFSALRQGALGTGGPSYLVSTGGPQAYWLARKVTANGWLIPTLRTAETLYKPWEYDFVVPPDGLADALVAAQNWVPWEGPITLVADDVSASNLLPYKYHLAGGLPVCASMGALAKGVTHDIFRGRTTIDLGAPARVDYGSLVSRVRQDPKDNIIYL